jgi:hypothetical protein
MGVATLFDPRFKMELLFYYYEKFMVIIVRVKLKKLYLCVVDCFKGIKEEIQNNKLRTQ